MGRFETAWLASDDNRAALADLSGAWIDKARCNSATVIRDMDISVSPTHGDEKGSSYTGHFGCSCYPPLFAFNQLDDLEHCVLRPGHVHSAYGWRELLEPVVERYPDRAGRRYFRADAAFAAPEVYEYLVAEGFFMRSACPATRFRGGASVVC